ncbi:two pore domain potassium channel family protein [Bacillus sp. HMF5848]|nr:two pore domain potassium channel family protein [Bacillus sp. HMF5848]
MLLLVIISISFIWIEHPQARIADFIIWLIFLGDYVVRLLKADEKKLFVKKNIFDLIVLIPFDSIFRVARLAKLIRLIRLFYIGSRFIGPVYNILKTNGLHKILSATVILIFVSAIPIYYFEPNIETMEDALWWSVVTATTVGYGDISPSTAGGRLIAIVLMIFGIGLVGMITGSIATYFLQGHEKEVDREIHFVQQQLSRFDELTSPELTTIVQILEGKREQLENRQKIT